MKKLLINLFVCFSLIIGLLQFLLIPGLIWNFLFPIILACTIFLMLFFRKRNTSKFNKICLILLSTVLVIEVGYRVFIQEKLSNPQNGIEIKVMTYNVFFKNRNHESSVKIIQNADPDILFVQELTPKWSNTINQKLGKIYPYKLERALKGTHGIGIYSKYKIIGHEYINNRSQKPIAQIAELSIKNKKIQVTNVHLASPAAAVENRDRFFSLYFKNYKLRKSQLNEINNSILPSADNYDCQLLVGDINTINYEPIFKSLKRNWVDTYGEKGNRFNFNFPNSSKIRPIINLDYILARGHVKCKAAKILKGGSSDHLGTISTIEI